MRFVSGVSNGPDGFFKRPPTGNPESQRGIGYTDATSPVFKWKCFSAMRQHAIGGSILGLVLWGFPFAVLRGIAGVIFFSFNRESTRARPHVVAEINEPTASAPSITNEYSSSAIPIKSWVSRVPASIVHRGPYFVDSGLGLPVLGVCVPDQATARLRYPASQVRSSDIRRAATRTSAFPKPRSTNMSNEPDRSKAAKHHPEKVNCCGHVRPLCSRINEYFTRLLNGVTAQ